MKRGEKKPYEKSSRRIAGTVPNVLVDAIEKEMEEDGEVNMSAKLAEIIQWWIDTHPRNGKPIPPAGSELLDQELDRFKGFSGSRFI